MTFTPDPDLKPIVAQLRTEGYAPVHWVMHEKGVRVDQVTGKVSIPSDFTKARVCTIHGNLVKVRHETFAGSKGRGICILDVLPCLFCVKDPAGLIRRSPITR